jgi:endoglucanase
VAEAEKIPYQINASPSDTGTDADAIHTARKGIPTGLIAIPNRYMHSPSEMIDTLDVERAARLIAAFARRLTNKTRFVPR